jgi:hypothetical protein
MMSWPLQVVDQDAVPVAGATVTYHFTDQTSKAYLSGSDGLVLPPGSDVQTKTLSNYTASKAGYDPTTQTNQASAIQIHQTGAHVNSTVPPPASLAVHVQNAQTGQPLSGATVFLDLSTGTRTQTTDSGGSTTFGQLPVNASIKVTASATNLGPQSQTLTTTTTPSCTFPL